MTRLEQLEEKRIEWETKLSEAEIQLKLIDAEVKSIEEVERLVETLNETLEKLTMYRDVYARDGDEFHYIECARIDKDGDVILYHKDEE